MIKRYIDPNVFIAVAEDCPAKAGVPPKGHKGKPTVAEVQYRMLVDEAYQHTQEDVMLASSRLARENPKDMRAAREEFFSKSQACLRTSPLAKTYGWGIHFDDHGMAAAYGVETDQYDSLTQRNDLRQTRAMRNKRDR